MYTPPRNTRITAFFAIVGMLAVLGLIFGIRHLYENQLTIPLTPITEGGLFASETQNASSSVTTARKSSRTLLTTLKTIPNTVRFRSLLTNTSLSTALTGTGPYTLFVPTDTAFRQLPSGTIDTLTSTQLKRLVAYHIVDDRALDLTTQKTGVVTALSGDALNVSLNGQGNAPRVNSSVVTAQYKTTNGVIYLIDTVLIPPIK